MKHLNRNDFAAVNIRGYILRTFDTLERAAAWVDAHNCEHDGLCVFEIATNTRLMYTPAQKVA
jgi:hypothetical protein